MIIFGVRHGEPIEDGKKNADLSLKGIRQIRDVTHDVIIPELFNTRRKVKVRILTSNRPRAVRSGRVIANEMRNYPSNTMTIEEPVISPFLDTTAPFSVLQNNMARLGLKNMDEVRAFWRTLDSNPENRALLEHYGISIQTPKEMGKNLEKLLLSDAPERARHIPDDTCEADIHVGHELYNMSLEAINVGSVHQIPHAHCIQFNCSPKLGILKSSGLWFSHIPVVEHEAKLWLANMQRRKEKNEHYS